MPAAAIAAATAVAGGVLKSNAANSAAKAQENASATNVSANNAFLGQVGNDVNPTIGYGNAAGGELAGLLGTGGDPAAAARAFDTFRNSTNYQFLLNQGLQGQSYLNAPNLFSGATGKALNNYAQGMAGNALQGYEGILQNQQSLGLQGSQIYGQTGLGVAQLNNNANNLAAGAKGSAALAGANAWSNALNGVGSAVGGQFGASSFGGAGTAAPGAGVYSSNAFGGGNVTGLDTNVGQLSSPLAFTSSLVG